MHALLGGPWLIFGHYLITQPWDKDFDADKATINKVIAWIRVPGMSLHLYDKRVLRQIGRMVGKLVKIYYNTNLFGRAKFARLAVEVDLTKPLVASFTFKEKIHKIVYEGFPRIFFYCGHFGHVIEHCSENPEASIVHNSVSPDNHGASTGPNQQDNSGPTSAQPYGPWMLVQKRGRRITRNQSKGSNVTSSRRGDRERNGSNRFAILEDERDEHQQVTNPLFSVDNGGNTYAAAATQMPSNSRQTFVEKSKAKQTTESRTAMEGELIPYEKEKMEPIRSDKSPLRVDATVGSLTLFSSLIHSIAQYLSFEKEILQVHFYCYVAGLNRSWFFSLRKGNFYFGFQLSCTLS